MMFNDPHYEDIAGGEWSAIDVADRNPDLYLDVVEIFLLLDPRTVQASVLDHRQAEFLRVIEAIDDVFGDLSDPLADEDGEAPDTNAADIKDLLTQAEAFANEEQL
ncbi:hypothetical protein ACFVWR_18905 [Leifsonia sp. NPDC058292]|uniref:hypothetical protein n=1 Tax=Leifsonia sp. NPDC058292 TaxID=3346428 RepID=UPI0036DBC22B